MSRRDISLVTNKPNKQPASLVGRLVPRCRLH